MFIEYLFFLNNNKGHHAFLSAISHELFFSSLETLKKLKLSDKFLLSQVRVARVCGAQKQAHFDTFITNETEVKT